MRSTRRARLAVLTKVLEEGPKKNSELRGLPIYQSHYQLESDCIVLFKAGIVDLRGGLNDRRNEIVVLERQVTPKMLKELFPFRGFLSND